MDIILVWYGQFQSTPLHQWWPNGGRDGSDHQISIHTTASVVTEASNRALMDYRISIHTTASVVTTPPWRDGDLCTISIHTTASVVTYEYEDARNILEFQSTPLHQWWRLRYFLSRLIYNFNPHHCISGDIDTIIIFSFWRLFQSTPLHQWWLHKRWRHFVTLIFQSTPLHQWWLKVRNTKRIA